MPHAGTPRQPHVMPRNSNPRRGNWSRYALLRMTRAWRVAAATHRARTPSQPARHTRRRQAQFIGCLRPWDGYPAVPSPPRLPPDGASTSLPVYHTYFTTYLRRTCRRPCRRRAPRSRFRRLTHPALARRRGAPAAAATGGERPWATRTDPYRVNRTGPAPHRLASFRNRRPHHRRPGGSSRRLPRSGMRLNSSRRSRPCDSRHRHTWTPRTRRSSATHAASTTSPPTEVHTPRLRLARAPHLPRLRLVRAPDSTRPRLVRAPPPRHGCASSAPPDERTDTGTDRQTERQRDRQTDRETERQRDRETERQGDRETERRTLRSRGAAAPTPRRAHAALRPAPCWNRTRRLRRGGQAENSQQTDSSSDRSDSAAAAAATDGRPPYSSRDRAGTGRDIFATPGVCRRSRAREISSADTRAWRPPYRKAQGWAGVAWETPTEPSSRGLIPRNYHIF